MWLFLRGPEGEHSFLSVVADADDPNLLLVRARFEHDIERLFPTAEVHEGLGSDYLFRAWIDRDDVARAIAESIGAIDYTNFKDSVGEPWRGRGYFGVWDVMLGAQEERQRAGRGAR